MKIVIYIPDNEVPKRQEIVEIGLHFMDGEVCECTYPFQVLPKGHGRLIDANDLDITTITTDDYSGNEVLEVVLKEDVDNAPTIIEADKGEEE